MYSPLYISFGGEFMATSQGKLVDSEKFPTIPQTKGQLLGWSRPEIRVGGWQWSGWGRWQWGGWNRPDPNVGRSQRPVVKRRREKDENRGGYDCDFTHPPPIYLQTECSICLLVLRSPHIASCCSHNFCKECIECVRKARRPCPLCNGKNFTLTYNREKEVSLQQTEVYCPNTKIGCEWTGKLEMLDTHLNVNPKLDKQLEGCGFVEVECYNNGCKQSFPRQLIALHQCSECPLRVFTCEHCHEYESTYRDIMSNHWPVCSYYPLPCPNKCGEETIQRQNLEQHLNEECSLLEMECEFKYAGCKAKLPRKDMPDHLRDNADHVIMFARQNQLLAQQNEEIMAKFMEVKAMIMSASAEINGRYTAAEQELEADYGEIEHQVKKTEHRRNNSVLEMERRIAAEVEKGIATPDEVKTLKVRVGEAERSTTATKTECKKLVQQVVPRRKLTSLVQRQEATNRSLMKIQHSTARVAEVATLKTQTGHLLRKQDTVTTSLEKLHHHVHIAPVQIVMTNYEQYKWNNDRWYSDGFYTHPQGYKLCLVVYANGDGSAKGTHMTCCISLMHGEFDNHLKWPFRGAVIITLLNQREDKNHHTCILDFDDRAPDKCTGRVMTGERADSVLGNHTFIPISELRYKRPSNCYAQYLVKNCLYFQVKAKLC